MEPDTRCRVTFPNHTTTNDRRDNQKHIHVPTGGIKTHKNKKSRKKNARLSLVNARTPSQISHPTALRQIPRYSVIETLAGHQSTPGFRLPIHKKKGSDGRGLQAKKPTCRTKGKYALGTAVKMQPVYFDPNKLEFVRDSFCSS